MKPKSYLPVLKSLADHQNLRSISLAYNQLYEIESSFKANIER